jgi:hypothetical protein
MRPNQPEENQQEIGGKRAPLPFYGFVRIRGDGRPLGVEPTALTLAMPGCPGLPLGGRMKVSGGRFIVSSFHTLPC